MLKWVFNILLFLAFPVAEAQEISGGKDKGKFESLIKTNSLAADSNIYLITVRTGQQVNKIPGIRVIRQLDQFHYIIKSKLRISSEDVVLQFPANSLWKASDNLLKETQRSPKAKADIVLLLAPGTSHAAVELHGFENVRILKNRIYLRLSIQDLDKLLSNDVIIFAELQRVAKDETLINNLDLSVNQINRVHTIFPAINGKGVTVSLKEGLFNANDIDLLGRIITSPTQSSVVSEHATVMATLVAGNGNSFVKGLGAAPAASLSSSDYRNLSPDSTAILINLGVSVQNHSYGTGIENYYGLEAVEYDRQIYEADTLIHVFSAGNSGTVAPGTGIYAGLANFSNLTGTFKQAKNVMVIGGTNNENIAEALSSAGPAYDGRIKPEIVAAAEDGTSGAAALTSGVVSLLQQQYKLKAGHLPSSALVRAILVNSADDLGRPAPDYKYGYGKLNGYQAVQTVEENRYVSGSVAQTEEIVIPLSITEPDSEVKVTIAWNDHAAEINAPRALINDLDLRIIAPSGNQILPWVLNSYPHIDSLTMPAIRRTDSLNNIEQVTFTAPAGNFQIHVAGKRVISGRQNFYISYQVKPVGRFEWTYPLEGDRLIADELNYMRWDNSLSVANGTVSVSYDDGSSWNEISAVDLKAGYTKWEIPDIFSRAILKMSVNNQDFISASFFVSKPPKLSVGYNCTDAVLLTWPKNSAASSYNLYTLKDNKVQILKTTTDTIIEVKRAEITSDYFALSSVHFSGFEGIRSPTLNASLQGVACYFQSLLADIGSGKEINLSLKLGTVVGLKAIRWEKQTGPGTYSLIGTAIVNAGLTYGFNDYNPKQGIQYYRVVLETQDGREIISDLASAIYLDIYKFTLFPNPVSQAFTVLSGSNEDFDLDIYNTQGQKVFTGRLNNISQSYNIDSLKNGIYVCVISLKGRIMFRSKIIKI